MGKRLGTRGQWRGFPKAVEKELQISAVASQKELSFFLLSPDCVRKLCEEEAPGSRMGSLLPN